jgi:ATP-binding cassette subfamily B protein
VLLRIHHFKFSRHSKVIESRGTLDQLLIVSLGLLGLRAAFAVVDMINTVIREFLASRMERDAREELYISLLSKSQTFHNRQRVGDLMAAATGDVSQLNMMISPGISLIIEATTQLITPLIAIAALNPALLPVPVVFVASLIWGLIRYNKKTRTGGRCIAWPIWAGQCYLV